jgi:hypothetical protein
MNEPYNQRNVLVKLGFTTFGAGLFLTQGCKKSSVEADSDSTKSNSDGASPFSVSYSSQESFSELRSWFLKNTNHNPSVKAVLNRIGFKSLKRMGDILALQPEFNLLRIINNFNHSRSNDPRYLELIKPLQQNKNFQMIESI